MEVQLSDAARDAIMRRVANGDFPSADAAVDEAVRVLEEQHQDYVRYAQEAIDEGEADIKAGRVVEATPEFYESIRQRVKERIERRLAGETR